MPDEARPDRRDGPPPTRVFPPLPTDPSALPALPRAFEAALDAGLEALGLELPGVAREAIESHVRLLLAWNAAVNLTAITDPAAVALKHVVDSLAAVPMLEWVAGRDGGSFLDLGSGGGFPGLPLAAALPAARATLVDSVGKKARFLAVATRASGLADRVRVVNARAEALAGERTWDAVTARGVAGLDELVELALPLLAVGGRLVAWKRGRIDAELAAAGRASRRIGGSMPEPRAVDVPGLEGHVLVVIEKLGPTPDGYPRDPAERRGRPW